MNNFTNVKDSLPPEGVVVEAITPSGDVQELKRNGNLWFFPDGSMYVYYVPTHWRIPQKVSAP